MTLATLCLALDRSMARTVWIPEGGGGRGRGATEGRQWLSMAACPLRFRACHPLDWRRSYVTRNASGSARLAIRFCHPTYVQSNSPCGSTAWRLMDRGGDDEIRGLCSRLRLGRVCFLI